MSEVRAVKVSQTGRGVAGGGDLGPLRALTLANLRFWATVARPAGRELAWWRGPARAIEDSQLRALASEKLEHEDFNAQVAATLATLAPREWRRECVQAIVSLELLFDYLDGRTERLGEDVLAQGALLFAPFTSALAFEDSPQQRSGAPVATDWAYLSALAGNTRARFRTLPGARMIAPAAGAALARCAEAQTRIHAIEALGVEQLHEWALAAGAGSGLGWREYAAGCASSVLAAHALLAKATHEGVSETDAQRIDQAYLAIGAAITILDSLVDAAEDREQGRRGYTSLYEPAELAHVLPALVREALTRSLAAPDGDHHAMTLAGVIAYYTSHPGARRGEAREVAVLLRAELSPTVWPALAVMRLWRGAKQARALARRVGLNAAGRPTGAHARNRA
ncbi:MAG TPA: DUF2600 family protein [Solirubrobacteraceae bacterium]|nr:DUF2600 family protein [Solirubrobacteraceae bacterium]